MFYNKSITYRSKRKFGFASRTVNWQHIDSKNPQRVVQQTASQVAQLVARKVRRKSKQVGSGLKWRGLVERARFVPPSRKAADDDDDDDDQLTALSADRADCWTLVTQTRASHATSRRWRVTTTMTIRTRLSQVPMPGQWFMSNCVHGSTVSARGQSSMLQAVMAVTCASVLMNMHPR